MICSMSIPLSTIYREGNLFSSSQYQGSTYQEVTYTQRLAFDPTLTMTESLVEAITPPTVTNYPMVDSSFFMGRFDGFWVHRIYNDGRLVMTVQGVNQDMFIPVIHDRIESVCMQTGLDGDDIDTKFDDPFPPDVPSAGTFALFLVGALVATRKRKP